MTARGLMPTRWWRISTGCSVRRNPYELVSGFRSSPVCRLDATTVRFTTKFVDPFFLDRLANVTGAIESPAAFAKYGKDLARRPVGTGPFKFREWVQDDHIALIRNDNYWGNKPYL